MTFTLDGLTNISHSIAERHGWWDEPATFGEKIALMHSELSEALEEYRNGHHYKEIYWTTDSDGQQKPEGIPIEFADVFIRICDFAGQFGVDLEEAVRIKTDYNRGRPYKHGGKKI